MADQPLLPFDELPQTEKRKKRSRETTKIPPQTRWVRLRPWLQKYGKDVGYGLLVSAGVSAGLGSIYMGWDWASAAKKAAPKIEMPKDWPAEIRLE